MVHEALSATIPHIFESLPIDRLEADVDPRNSASLRLLSRLGFCEVGRAASRHMKGGTLSILQRPPGGCGEGNGAGVRHLLAARADVLVVSGVPFEEGALSRQCAARA